MPSTFTLERSKIRLNILEDLAPIEAPVPSKQPDSAAGGPSPNVDNDSQSSKKKLPSEYPYTCFVEQSGLLVAISHSGFCCKFSVDLQIQPSHMELRSGGFSPRAGRSNNALALSHNRLSYQLEQIKDVGLPRKTSQRRPVRPNSRVPQRMRSPNSTQLQVPPLADARKLEISSVTPREISQSHVQLPP